MVKALPSIFALLFTAFSPLLFAQRTTLIGFETGFYVLAASIRDTENIRADISQFQYENESVTSLQSSLLCYSTGLKIEIATTNNRFSFSGGLKYSRMEGTILQNKFSFGVNYFFYRFREDGLTTEYLRVHRFNQYTDYLSVPAEVRYFLSRHRKFRFYLISGADMNIRLNTNERVVFADSQMSIFEKDVVKAFKKPGKFNVIGYIGGGIRFGRTNKPVYGVSLMSPSFSLTPRHSGIVKPTAGVGIQFHIELPVNRISNE